MFMSIDKIEIITICSFLCILMAYKLFNCQRKQTELRKSVARYFLALHFIVATLYITIHYMPFPIGETT